MSQQFGPSGQGPGQGPGPGQVPPSAQPGPGAPGWQHPGGQPPIGPPPVGQPPFGPPPAGQPPFGPPPVGQQGSGWGPGAADPGGQGPFGYPPGQLRGKRKSKLPFYAVLGVGALALLLVVAGAIMLTTGGSEEGPSAAPPSQGIGDPPPTVPPSVPTKPEITKGPNDVGVEIGKGVWFTPAKGWVRAPEKSAGANYLLPEPGRRGAIDGYFWARQSELRGAKDFAHHLVDLESQNLEHVVVRNGRTLPCKSPTLKVCYAINYSAVVRRKGQKPVIFAGFIQAFEDQNGLTTATDAALQDHVFRAKYPEVHRMVESMIKSFD